MTVPISSLVSTQWLAEHLDQGNLAILDATKHLPAAGRDARGEFAAAHIPGARFLDLASLKDPASMVPDALPTRSQVKQRLDELGIGPSDAIVIYDDSDVKTSARAWFSLRIAGIDNVAILDGGLAKWRSEGRPLDSGAAGDFSHPEEKGDPIETGVRTKAQMLANIDAATEQVLDARGADRVFGSGVDPVHGGPNGRIPGALCLPFGNVFAADGSFKSPEDLRAAFAMAGVDLDKPIVTSCGSGVTASVLLFALHLIGKDDVALYDGSWQEWSADPATPKAQGPEEAQIA